MVFLNHIQLAFEEKALVNLLSFLEEKTQSYLLSHALHGSINVLFNGELAVYVFWFLSAYVISIKLFTTSGNSYLLKATVKRYFRLAIPVLGSVIFAYVLVKSEAMYNNNVHQLSTEHWISKMYLFSPDAFIAFKSALWNTFFDPGGSETYNAVLWTMQPELYGSLLCFLIFAVVRTNRYRFVLYSISIFISIFLLKYWATTFLIGFWLCDLDYSTSKHRLTFAINFVFQNQRVNGLLFIALVVLAGLPNYYGFFYIPMSGLIVLFVLRTRPLQQFLQSRIMLWLGKISFSLYLLHLPLICSFSCYLYIELPYNLVPKLFIVSVTTIALVLVVATIFSKYVDGFAIRIASRIADFAYKKAMS